MLQAHPGVLQQVQMHPAWAGINKIINLELTQDSSRLAEQAKQPVGRHHPHSPIAH
jgi:hypothetical protein